MRFCFWTCLSLTLVLTLLTTSGQISTADEVDAPEGPYQPNADARSAGAGNAASLLGAHDGWLWTPSHLGFSPRSEVWISRGLDTPPENGLGTSEAMSWRNSGFRTSSGLRLFAYRRPRLDELESRREILRSTGSIAWLVSEGAPMSMGMTFGLQQTSEGGNRQGGGLGSLSLTYRPFPELFVTQGATVFYGDAFGTWDASRMLVPTTSIMMARSRIPITAVLEFRGSRSEAGGWRGGVELDALDLFKPSAPIWERLALRLRTGASDDGITFGAGLSVGDFAIDYARARYDDADFNVLSLSQAWGKDWGSESRREVTKRDVDARRALAAAHDQLRGGDVAGALESTQRASALATRKDTRDEARELLKNLESIGPRLQQADEYAQHSETIQHAQQIYLEIQGTVPGLAGLDERISVGQLINTAMMHFRTNEAELGHQALARALAIAPRHPVARTLALTRGEGIEVSVNGDTMYAGLFEAYEEHPPLTLVVRNALPISVDGGEVKYRLGNLMMQKVWAAAEIPPIGADARVEVELPLVLDPHKLIYIKGEDHPSLEMQVTLRASDGRSTLQYEKPFSMMGVGMLDWSDPRRFGAYVQGEDTQVRRMSQVVPPTPIDEFRQTMAGPTQAVYDMMATHSLMRAMNLEFSGEVVAFSERDGEVIPHDRIRLPAQVLAERMGDCEDLAALWASLLKARGVATVLLVERQNIGHVLLLADTQLPPTRSELLCGLEPFAYSWRGRLWLPIEATLTDENFVEVVSRAHELIGHHFAESPFEPFSILESQTSYPAPHWPTTESVVPPKRALVLDSIRATLRDSALACEWASPKPSSLPGEGVGDDGPTDDVGEDQEPSKTGSEKSKSEQGPSSESVTPPSGAAWGPKVPPLDRTVSTGSCATSLRGGVYLGQTARLEEARPLLARASACGSTRSAGLNGLGNVQLLAHDDPKGAVLFYSNALELDPTDDGIRLNLLISHRLLSMRGEEASETIIVELGEEIRGRMDYRHMLQLLGQVPPRSVSGSTGAEVDRGQQASMLRFLDGIVSTEGDLRVADLPTTSKSMSDVGALIYWKKQTRSAR